MEHDIRGVAVTLTIAAGLVAGVALIAIPDAAFPLIAIPATALTTLGVLLTILGLMGLMPIVHLGLFGESYKLTWPSS